MTASRLSLFLSLFLLPLSAAASFTDVPSSHPNTEAILTLQERGIIQGYGDGSFHPNAKINRAEFVKIVEGATEDETIINACTEDIESDYRFFSDVEPGVWYEAFLCDAVGKSIISGYPDDTFRGEKTINFSEAAKIIAKAFSYADGETMIGAAAPGEPWYKPYVVYLANRHAIPISIRSFEQEITRGNMAEMVFRILTNYTEAESKTYDDFTSSTITLSKSLPVGNYVLLMPGDWSLGATTQENIYTKRTPILDSKGKEVARIQCPPVETGYEAWTITDTKNRTFSQGRASYKGTLYTFTPIGQIGVNLQQFYRIALSDNADTWNTMCEIIAESKDEKLWADIYMSATVLP